MNRVRKILPQFLTRCIIDNIINSLDGILMTDSNLYLQTDWSQNDRIFRYTIFTVNKAMMAYWSEQVIKVLREWQNTDTVRLLFDLSHTNVSMSYFVLTGRNLLNVGITPEGQQVFIDFLEQHPDCEFKLAVLLSNTMLGALTKHVPEEYIQTNFTGKIFFDSENAEQWLIAEQAELDIKTGAIPTEQLSQVMDELNNLSPDVYGNRQQLRMIVMGSLEVVSIEENLPIIIGRGPKADLNVRSYGYIARSVSRRHAQISLANGRLSIVDLDSRNGTTISGRKLESGKAAFIGRDDVIKLGQVAMTVVF